MGKREASRQRIEAQILALARQQLVTEGAAGLSVRAIARDLGMASSAVYRYVASRDELLTLLLVDAYSQLADHVELAREGAAGAGWQGDVTAIARATRQWALEQPACWALLYGSPVPGYHAPAELTIGPGTRVVQALFDAVASGIASGTVMQTKQTVAQSLSEDLQRLRVEFGFHGDDALAVRCTVGWAVIVGAISLEVFGQYGLDTFADSAALFDEQVRILIDLLAGPRGN
jgi:AcrR family transcriptional regulator